MTDELNLVPTNNLEKHLDNILRAASGEEPQYDLAPNWHVEQYLAAIAAKLSGGVLPPTTSADAGKVLAVNNSGVWGASYPARDGWTKNGNRQEIPVTASIDGGGLRLSTNISPKDVDDGYTIDDRDYPRYKDSSYTCIRLIFGEGVEATLKTSPLYGDSDGLAFQSECVDMSGVGMSGYIGYIILEPNLYDNHYDVTLISWQGSIITFGGEE